MKKSILITLAVFFIMLPVSSFAKKVALEVDVETWTLVYENDSSGSVVQGSYNDLAAAFSGGAEIKVIIDDAEMLNKFDGCWNNTASSKIYCVLEQPYIPGGAFDTTNATRVTIVSTTGTHDAKYFNRDGTVNYYGGSSTLPMKWFIHR